MDEEQKQEQGLLLYITVSLVFYPVSVLHYCSLFKDFLLISSRLQCASRKTLNRLEISHSSMWNIFTPISSKMSIVIL